MGRVPISAEHAIGFEERGTGAATPILFLHGVGSDKSAWQPQLLHFGRHRRAVALDYPGYGDSDPAPEGTTREDYAGAILAAMREFGIERAHICGLSLGGVVAIALHHAAPDACASLILADTFAFHPDGHGIYERALAGSRDLRAMAEARVDLLLAAPADPAVRAEVIATMSRIEPAAYRIGAAAVWLADLRQLVADIRVPTLVVCGEEDKPTPPELSRDLHERIPLSRLEIIARAGHLTNLEQPQQFNRLVDEFFADAEALAQR